ncbi:hypothetical protein BofuT4_uP086690.1 [Botrytis cinerea T4]|uniref:Uncharacterized protein n=1 Tax=Botryotinia fuckeliana (strain T4) TaxID=999810 RepID=G2YGJ2_BOTF4|nr:hypothetical protein BofuT4_uP086690.1 [Botrytis cinerea T4]
MYSTTTITTTTTTPIYRFHPNPNPNPFISNLSTSIIQQKYNTFTFSTIYHEQNQKHEYN